MDNFDDKIDKKIFKLRSYYVQKFPDKILAIENHVELIKSGQDFYEHVNSLRSILHTFYGTAGTYGFEDLGKVAKTALNNIISELEDNHIHTEELADTIEKIVSVVGEKIIEIYESYEVDHSNNLGKEILKTDLDYSKVLYISKMEDETDDEFVSFMNQIKMKVDVVGIEIDTLINYFQKNLPVVVFVNMEDVLENYNLFSKMIDLRNSYLQVINFIYVSKKIDIDTRLKAVKLGADFFFSFPNESSSIADYIDYNVLYHDSSNPRVIILNDSDVKSKGYASMLQSAGMETCIVNDPLDISKYLIEFSPDIVIMEMYMNACSGVDLAKVIKQQSAYSSLPIIFTSSEGSSDKKLLALENGGDDYFHEPIEPGYLIQSVSIRSERMKRIKSKLDKDGLTKLYNHKKSKELLEIEFSRSKRYGKNFVFAMLDIDFFKKVNDTYGHLIGDSVLRSFSSILQKRFRKTDIIGRYGGEEFSVMLMETSLYFAEIVFNKLREEFEKVVHYSNEDSFSVTFSCGIASADEFESAEELNKAADDSLYQAKDSGRNRVVIAHKKAFIDKIS